MVAINSAALTLEIGLEILSDYLESREILPTPKTRATSCHPQPADDEDGISSTTWESQIPSLQNTIRVALVEAATKTSNEDNPDGGRKETLSDFATIVRVLQKRFHPYETKAISASFSSYRKPDHPGKSYDIIDRLHHFDCKAIYEVLLDRDNADKSMLSRTSKTTGTQQWENVVRSFQSPYPTHLKHSIRLLDHTVGNKIPALLSNIADGNKTVRILERKCDEIEETYKDMCGEYEIGCDKLGISQNKEMDVEKEVQNLIGDLEEKSLWEELQEALSTSTNLKDALVYHSQFASFLSEENIHHPDGVLDTLKKTLEGSNRDLQTSSHHPLASKITRTEFLHDMTELKFFLKHRLHETQNNQTVENPTNNASTVAIGTGENPLSKNAEQLFNYLEEIQKVILKFHTGQLATLINLTDDSFNYRNHSVLKLKSIQSRFLSLEEDKNALGIQCGKVEKEVAFQKEELELYRARAIQLKKDLETEIVECLKDKPQREVHLTGDVFDCLA